MRSPSRSPLRPPTSPPLSESVLKLQRLGLELGASGSQSSLRIPSYTTSACTTPSDLDKPLPLEPPELRRRTSSVYSNETTISDIINLYGGLVDEDDYELPQFHNPQAYRDTVAPLMARRMSLTHSTWLPPIVPHQLRTSVSSPVMRGPVLSPDIYTPDSRTAPSFVEFSRNLREKKTEMVSPASFESYKLHRQDALEKLAPPSPQDSSEALPVAFESPQSFLPGPMSGTITDVVTPDLVPVPLDLSRTSQVLRSPQEAARRAQREQLESLPQHFQQPDTNQSWSKIMDKLNKRRSTEEREKQRVLNYASEKYPGMRGSQRKGSGLSSNGSMTQRASNIIQALSGTGLRSDKDPTSDTTPRRQKRLAVKNTPYQEYGPDVFLPPEKREKKKRREERKLEREAKEEKKKGHRRNTSSASKGSGYSSAYYSGQSQIVGVIAGAKQRLSRSASEKRREKLKNSIVMMGPTKVSREKNSFEGAGGWK